MGRAQVVAAPLGSRCCSAKASRTNRHQCRSDLNASPVNVAAARFVFRPPAGRRRWRGVFLPHTSSPSARHARGEEGTCPLSSVCLCPRGLSAGRCVRVHGDGCGGGSHVTHRLPAAGRRPALACCHLRICLGGCPWPWPRGGLHSLTGSRLDTGFGIFQQQSQQRRLSRGPPCISWGPLKVKDGAAVPVTAGRSLHNFTLTITAQKQPSRGPRRPVQSTGRSCPFSPLRAGSARPAAAKERRSHVAGQTSWPPDATCVTRPLPGPPAGSPRGAKRQAGQAGASGTSPLSIIPVPHGV